MSCAYGKNVRSITAKGNIVSIPITDEILSSIAFDYIVAVITIQKVHSEKLVSRPDEIIAVTARDGISASKSGKNIPECRAGYLVRIHCAVDHRAISHHNRELGSRLLPTGVSRSHHDAYRTNIISIRDASEGECRWIEG